MLEIALKHRREFAESLVASCRDRAALAEDLRSVPAIERVVEGGGNFVVAELRRRFAPPAGIVTYLLAAHRVYVKDVSTKIADGGIWLRLAVRDPVANRQLVALLRDLPLALESDERGQ